MCCEIERKFLVDLDKWQNPGNGVRIMQGYLVRNEKISLRLRLADDKAFLTIKGASNGISRSEFEYEIPPEDLEAMFEEFGSGKYISKMRYYEKVGSHLWEIDIFEGDNAGLAVAEIELASVGEEFEMPVWATEEVSGDKRYRNACLVENPYKFWK
jgi:adenylate cyclase